MLVTELKSNETETVRAIQGPSVMIVNGGYGTMRCDGREYEVKEGVCVFHRI
jgi:mannose-6-phosphate isomerase